MVRSYPPREALDIATDVLNVYKQTFIHRIKFMTGP